MTAAVPASTSPASTSPTGTPSGREPRRSATQGRWWLLGFALIALATLGRLPVVLDEVRSSVDARIASGDLPDTEQRTLAVAIGVTVALAVYLTVTLVLVAVARRVEPHCRLPVVELGRLRVPGMVFLVVGIALAVQVTALVLRSPAPRSEPGVWVTALAVSATAVASVARRGASRRAMLRLVACALVVTLVSLVL